MLSFDNSSQTTDTHFSRKCSPGTRPANRFEFKRRDGITRDIPVDVRRPKIPPKAWLGNHIKMSADCLGQNRGDGHAGLHLEVSLESDHPSLRPAFYMRIERLLAGSAGAVEIWERTRGKWVRHT